MKLFVLLSLQAAAAPDARVSAVDFDLARYKPADDPKTVESLFACRHPRGPEIVVCGRRGGNAYPLDKMSRIFESKPLRAEKDLGGGATVDTHVEQAKLSEGIVSNRAMVRLKIRF